MIAVVLEIENHYELYDTVLTTVSTVIDEPPLDKESDEYEEWEQECIFEHTGTGHTDGDSSYFVTVKESSRPDLLPVGTEFEFGV